MVVRKWLKKSELIYVTQFFMFQLMSYNPATEESFNPSIMFRVPSGQIIPSCIEYPCKQKQADELVSQG